MRTYGDEHNGGNDVMLHTASYDMCFPRRGYGYDVPTEAIRPIRCVFPLLHTCSVFPLLHTYDVCFPCAVTGHMVPLLHYMSPMGNTTHTMCVSHCFIRYVFSIFIRYVLEKMDDSRTTFERLLGCVANDRHAGVAKIEGADGAARVATRS